MGYEITIRCDVLAAVEMSSLRDMLRDMAQCRPFAGLDLNPRTCASRGALLCTYHRWFARPACRVPGILGLPVSHGQLIRFIRFRTSCHGLPVDVGRHHNIPRWERLCTACGRGVGDEYHLVFECQALQSVRGRYSHLFTPDTGTLRAFMWQRQLLQVVKFVGECMDIVMDTSDGDAAGSPNQP